MIMSAIAPEGGAIKISQLINTPKEFQGKELNILVTGVDRSTTGTCRPVPPTTPTSTTV